MRVDANVSGPALLMGHIIEYRHFVECVAAARQPRTDQEGGLAVVARAGSLLPTAPRDLVEEGA